MAVVNLKSQQITDMTATPRVPVNGRVQGASLREASGTVTSGAADTSASTYRFCRVPSNACVSQVLISAADATTAGAINVGLYAADDGAVVDADLFASAFDLAGGPYTNQDITFESGEYTNAEADTALWEVLGLSADPGVEYDLTAAISTTFNGGPTSINMKIRYTV
jgi:hypothetical protein